MSEGFADTSLLVRYLTGEPVEMAERAIPVVENTEPLWITPVILAETAYVLQSVYSVEREHIVDTLQSLVMRRNIEMAWLAKELIRLQPGASG